MIFSSLYGSRLNEELGNEDSTVLFTTARRKSAINRGIKEFAELTECYLKWSTITMTGGTAEYDLLANMTDFVRLSKTPIEFEYVDASSNVTVLAGQDDLPHRDVKWLDDNIPNWRDSSTNLASSVQQMPILTYERIDGASRYLGFYPTPSTGSSASMKVRVPYVPDAPTLTSDTSEPYSNRVDLRPFHQASVHYGAYVLEKLRRDDQASAAQLQQFLGYVSRFLQNSRKKGGNVLSQARTYFRKGNPAQADDPRT